MHASAEADSLNRRFRKWPHVAVWIDLAIVFAAAVSYFLYFAQFPTLRDFPWLNLPLVLLATVFALMATYQVYRQGSGLLGKAMATLGAFLATAIAGLFCFYIFSLSYQLPASAAAPGQAEPAPAFSLLDHRGKPVSLADYRGRNLILVFYRGYW